MANRAHMEAIPPGRFERVLWLDEKLDKVLAEIPLHFGLEGLAAFEAQLFPRRQHLPLDPACPVCGVETDEGAIERQGAEFIVRYESCGHVLIMTEGEIEARCAGAA